jgi:hypothetical protein
MSLKSVNDQFVEKRSRLRRRSGGLGVWLCVFHKAERGSEQRLIGFCSTPLKSRNSDRIEGQSPSRVLGHPSEPGTKGRYLWCGQQVSEAGGFPDPMHLHRQIASAQ